MTPCNSNGLHLLSYTCKGDAQVLPTPKWFSGRCCCDCKECALNPLPPQMNSLSRDELISSPSSSSFNQEGMLLYYKTWIEHVYAL